MACSGGSGIRSGVSHGCASIWFAFFVWFASLSCLGVVWQRPWSGRGFWVWVLRHGTSPAAPGRNDERNQVGHLSLSLFPVLPLFPPFVYGGHNLAGPFHPFSPGNFSFANADTNPDGAPGRHGSARRSTIQHSANVARQTLYILQPTRLLENSQMDHGNFAPF